MPTENRDFATLAEIAKDERINASKSSLWYYYSLGLITPNHVAGKANIYEKEKTIRILERIKTLRLQGYELKDIKKMLEKK